MRFFVRYKKSEEGSILVFALFILLLLTILGIAASTTTQIELMISGNEKFHKLAFYAAEAAGGYVARNPELYGPENITGGEARYFPDPDPSVVLELSPTQSFNGKVEYVGFSAPPRGSGTQVGKFKAHKYRVTCYGYGPSNAESEIEAGFYRLGF